MAIPINKNQLIVAIQESYAKLQVELSTIPHAATSKRELEGHSKNETMSIENLVAYLIGWGELILKWNEGIERKQKVDFPETGYKWNQLGQLAKKFYKDYEKDNYKTLLEKLEKTVSKILLLINSKADKELYHTDWYDNWSLGRLIQLNTSSPYKNATARIRKWKKANEIVNPKKAIH